MSALTQRVEAALKEADIPSQNTVLYAFHPRMRDVVKTSGWSRPWSRLTPNLPPYGSGAAQRAVAAPSFVRNSFARLVSTHRAAGSPMMPCALDYMHGMRRHLPMGRSVGLTGRARDRLKATLEGFPAYVWPAPYRMETALIDAGLSLISDSVADPACVTLTDGCDGNGWPPHLWTAGCQARPLTMMREACSMNLSARWPLGTNSTRPNIDATSRRGASAGGGNARWMT